MAPTARIAVLECDTPLAHTRAKYGSYGGVFISLLQAGAEASKIPSQDLKISTWDVVNEEKYPELENIDAILITGSSMYAIIPPTVTKNGKINWGECGVGLILRLEEIRVQCLR